MAQAFPNAFNVDAAGAANSHNPYAAEAWLEPWLCKHSIFYRSHFTRDGRRESKSARRQSVIEQNSRKSSTDSAEERKSDDSAASQTPQE